MSNLLHVGLMLIISKVFIILCLLYLRRNREEPGNFQSKAVISMLFFQMSIQAKSEGRPFRSGQEAYGARQDTILQDYPQGHLVDLRDKKSISFCEI